MRRAIRAAGRGGSADSERGGAPGRRIIIGLDISKSNPLIDDPAFAAKVGARIAAISARAGLGLGSACAHLRQFRCDAKQFLLRHADLRAQPAGRCRPARSRSLISGTPVLVANGKWKAQGRTNILAFLDNVARRAWLRRSAHDRHSRDRRHRGFRNMSRLDDARRSTAAAGRQAVRRLQPNCRYWASAKARAARSKQRACAANGPAGRMRQASPGSRASTIGDDRLLADIGRRDAVFAQRPQRDGKSRLENFCPCASRMSR